MHNESQQDCVVLAFTGRQLRVFCSLPGGVEPAMEITQARAAEVIPVAVDSPSRNITDGMQCGAEELQNAVEACVVDVNRCTETINKQLDEIKEMVHAFADLIRRSDY